MIPIEIGTKELSAEFSLTQEDVDDLKQFTVETVTSAFAKHWDDVASISLGSTRDQYRRAIQVDSRGRFVGVAYLNPTSWIANAVEMGQPAFDMKPGFLNSPNAKMGKSGLYITIPFRFATPDAIGESGVFAGVMPSDIHQAIQKREKATPLGESTALQMGDIGSQYHIPKSNAYRNQLKAIGFDKMKQGTEVTSIYAGLKRNALGSGYVNFRRVSVNSPAEAFLHPGIEAKALADKAMQRLDIPHEVDMAIDNFLANMGF